MVIAPGHIAEKAEGDETLDRGRVVAGQGQDHSPLRGLDPRPDPVATIHHRGMGRHHPLDRATGRVVVPQYPIFHPTLDRSALDPGVEGHPVHIDQVIA